MQRRLYLIAFLENIFNNIYMYLHTNFLRKGNSRLYCNQEDILIIKTAS